MKFRRLEAIRGAAATYVALGHTMPHSGPLLSFGQEAVIVFFLLSGFVIEFSSRNTINRGFKFYFKKRFFRIYSILLCLFLVSILLETPAFSTIVFWEQLLGNLLMLQDFDTGKPNVIVPTLFASALWSLHYEWWFYMIYFPIVTKWREEQQTFIVGITGIVAAATYLIYPNVISRLLLYFPIWWMGVIFARIYISKGKILWKDILGPSSSLLMIVLLLSISCVQHVMGGGKFTPGIHPFLELRHLLAALIITFLAVLWQKHRWIAFYHILGWGCWIAPISYALYISHQPLFVHAHYLGGVMNPTAEKSLYLLGLLTFCWVTELWLYPKINRLTSKYSKEKINDSKAAAVVRR
jgi:peptidoglycan/LPS O-acetylase OafA/YrhL